MGLMKHITKSLRLFSYKESRNSIDTPTDSQSKSRLSSASMDAPLTSLQVDQTRASRSSTLPDPNTAAAETEATQTTQTTQTTHTAPQIPPPETTPNTQTATTPTNTTQTTTTPTNTTQTTTAPTTTAPTTTAPNTAAPSTSSPTTPKKTATLTIRSPTTTHTLPPPTPESIYQQAMCLFKGTPPHKQDFEGATKLLLEAANMGHARAQYKLAVCFSLGVSVEKDHVTAVSWYEKAAAQGTVDAMHSLGDAYRKGTGVDKDLAKSVSYYRMAAEQGDALAQYNMGVACEDGEGIEVNFKEAARWYKLAADQDHPDAQHNLGCLYLLGKGVDEDHATALEWFQKAAAQGYTLSQDILQQIEEDKSDSNADDDDDADGDGDDDSQGGPAEYQPPIERYPVKIFSTTTKANASIPKYEARLSHILHAKGVEFDLVDLDLHPKERAKEMFSISGTTDLPQLHVNGKFFGLLPLIQELEDKGSLDQMLINEGVSVLRKSGSNTLNRFSYADEGSTTSINKRDSINGGFRVPGNKPPSVSANCGILNARATAKFIRLRWGVSRLDGVSIAGSTDQWLLTMDGEPIYVGNHTDYVVSDPGFERHTFVLSRIESDTSPNINQRASYRVMQTNIAELEIAAPKPESGVPQIQLNRRNSLNFPAVLSARKRNISVQRELNSIDSQRADDDDN